MSEGSEDLKITTAGEGSGVAAPCGASLAEFAETSFIDDEMLSDLELMDDPDTPNVTGGHTKYVAAGTNALDLDHESFRDFREEPVDSAVSDEDYARYFSVPLQLEREWALAAEEHNEHLHASAGGACGPDGGDPSQHKPRDIREIARRFQSRFGPDIRMPDWDRHKRYSAAVKRACR